MTLMVCRTCPRDHHDTGRFAADLVAALATVPTRGRPLPVRQVTCVAGCPTPGSVALDGVGKTRIRFGGLSTTHAAALAEATLHHADAVHGDPDELDLPPELVAHISGVTRKRPTGDQA